MGGVNAAKENEYMVQKQVGGIRGDATAGRSTIKNG